MLEVVRNDQLNVNENQPLPDSRLTTPRDIHTSTDDLEGLLNERNPSE